jgi:hypothetical protein
MILTAQELAQITRKVAERELQELLKLKLFELTELTMQAAKRGETEISDYFVDHRIKREVIKHLTALGYLCVEQKVGNTFKISWRHLI